MEAGSMKGGSLYVRSSASPRMEFFGGIYRRARDVLVERVSDAYTALRRHPLLVFGLCGVCGVLVDADHFISAAVNMARPLHLQYLAAFWLGYLGYHAYCHRRFYQLGIATKGPSK